MVDPKATLTPGPTPASGALPSEGSAAETPAQRAARDQRTLKEQALQRQGEEAARRTRSEPWWQQALGAAANIKRASDAALEEANAKRAAELKQTPRAKGMGIGSLFKSAQREKLFDELDRALDAGNFELAAEIQKRIEEE